MKHDLVGGDFVRARHVVEVRTEGTAIADRDLDDACRRKPLGRQPVQGDGQVVHDVCVRSLGRAARRDERIVMHGDAGERRHLVDESGRRTLIDADRRASHEAVRRLVDRRAECDHHGAVAQRSEAHATP